MVANSTALPLAGPTAQQKVLPAYLYRQYADDVSLQQFFNAVNLSTQQYLTWMTNLGLPVYAGTNLIAGSLLDWVGLGLYGIPRPTISVGQQRTLGPLATYALAEQPTLAAQIMSGSVPFFVADDDTYKRVITWHHYRGDGYRMTRRWLRNRIARFVNGVNGTDVYDVVTLAQAVSLTGSGGAYVATVTRNSVTAVPAMNLQELIAAGLVELPFSTSFTMNLA